MSLLQGLRRLPPWRRREMGAAYLFILPALAIYIFFALIPVLRSMVISLYDWNGLSEGMTFVGLGNYVALFTNDPVFLLSLRNSVIATVILAVIPTALGLVFAAMAGRLRGGGAYRSAIFFPYLVSMVAVGLIWAWIYNPRVGAVDDILRAVGLGSLVRDWLGLSSTALWAALIPCVWRFTGFAIVIFYAAIQSIPVDLYEAARVDGASGWQSFHRITLPLVRDAVAVVVVWLTMDALKLFDMIFVLTKGGPNHGTEVLATWMFVNTFRHFRMGYGAAIAVVLFLLVFGFSVVYIRWVTRGAEE